MKRSLRQTLAVIALLCSSIVVSAEQRAGDAGEKGGERRADSRSQAREADSYFHRHGYTRLNIPKGHYPPPGECRVWFPDRPAGHQPPPSGCNARVPRGAWLIRHPHDNPEHVHVVVYDDRRPSTVLAIGEFRIGSGVFVRVVVDR
jgi:hypothetical protein